MSESLLLRARSLEGLNFRQLASLVHWEIPQRSVQRKGWCGQAIEYYLGGEAPQQAQPDFLSLGIELKTLPLNQAGRPAESTFITTLSLLNLHEETWETSSCLAKLRQVLWVPIEGDRKIAFPQRRIGRAVIWSPSHDELEVLKQDWVELTELIRFGNWHELHAGMGRYLQVRPKAANGKSLRTAYDEQGDRYQTLPRGFYLRARFTQTILQTETLVSQEKSASLKE